MKWTVTACWLSQKSWHTTEWGSFNHSVLLQRFITDTISTQTGTTGSGTVDFLLWARVLYIILSLSSMNLAINNVTNLCNFVGKMVCACVCVTVSLLRTFITLSTFKIHLTNRSPILIKTVDFKDLAWATTFANRASRKFIYLQGKWEFFFIVIPWIQVDEPSFRIHKSISEKRSSNIVFCCYRTPYPRPGSDRWKSPKRTEMRVVWLG